MEDGQIEALEFPDLGFKTDVVSIPEYARDTFEKEEQDPSDVSDRNVPSQGLV